MMDEESKQTARMYDKFGEQYHKYRKLRLNFYNSMVDMPAVLSFLKNIKKKKIIDLGCGPGFYSEILKKRGAKVYGIDISKTLIEIAKREVKEVDFRVADIKKIPFKNNTFDVALSALMLDYIKDWDTVFKEVRRVLKPGGIYIFSKGNPLFECRERIQINGEDCKILGYSKGGKKVIGSYFKERWQEAECIEGMKLRNHHKTYETIINTILRNGFSIEGYSDAKPLQKGRKIAPKHYKTFSKLPIFCVFKIRKKD